jgi:putative membrane protein
VLVRWVIRLGMTLVAIAVGLLLSAGLLEDFHVDTQGLVLATALFWVVHIVVQFLALRVLIRQPSIAMAGLLALASTIIALVVVNIVVDGISIKGAGTYVLATLIIWITTAAGDVVGGRMIRQRRRDRLE